LNLSRIQHEPKTGSERLHRDGENLPFTLLDFWRWSTSDLVSNATRGRLAEFIVATALGISVAAVRDEWSAWDLTSPEGVKVEVKSCAYLQSWNQKRPSVITFNVRKTRAWDPDTNLLAEPSERQAQVYVFALLHHLDKVTLDPLNIAQWSFWALPTVDLNTRTRSQHSITLASLTRMRGNAISYRELRAAVLMAAEWRAV
jgi:hypothetical protein